MVNHAEINQESVHPRSVPEDERPSLSLEFYENLLGLRECVSSEHCTDCGRCRY